jgi:diguanylate cyclase (GGDEF)-like protein
MAHAADGSTGEQRPPLRVEQQAAEELTRVHRALRTLSAGNRTLLRAADEQELLHEMCSVIVQAGGYRIAGVAYAVHDEQKNVRWMTCVGADIATQESFHFTWGKQGLRRSATGTAIRTGKPVVGRMLTDPAYTNAGFAPMLELAAELGFSSLTALPLRVEGEVIGCLMMGAAEPDAFDVAEVNLLTELADDLSYGISNQRTRVQHQLAQATIERLAFYDSLTGLPNLTLLLEKLNEAMQSARLNHRALALLHLEVGHFQEIKNALGNAAANELLQELARRLTQCCTGNELLARVGDAQFALVVPNSGAEHATREAKHLLRTLRVPVQVADLMLDARVGIGIALFPGHASEPEVLVQRANAAMHLTQPAAGGFAMYTVGLEQDYTRRLAMMGDLHRAIDNNELRLFCQPKVDFVSGNMCGAEALLRWEHPQHGMIAPAEFIKVAEQAGAITPLTHWMLEAVFSQSYAWHEAGKALPIAVNLSAHDLYDPRIVDRISGLFSTWGLAPELIQFELTESALMAEPEIALDVLVRLKKLGVSLFVDDFGTGYSGLSYLQRLPVDAIKIDQSFVKPMVVHPDSEVIVRSTIELGHNLGLKVVAEGVEDQATWERLKSLECDVAQGYLISRPMPAAQLQAWASEWRLLPDLKVS